MGPLWTDTAGPDDGPLVVLVHGSMDRSAGLLKLSRRLDGTHQVARYDRRGYGRSTPHDGPFDIDGHVDDLEDVLADRPAVLFGHSYGGHVALALAARRPELATAVAVYETPLSWLDWWPRSTAGGDALASGGDPEAAAERFMRRLIGDDRWARLPPTTRAARRAEGRAMVEELDELRSRPPWDAGAINVPVIAMRGSDGAEHHRRSTAHLADVLADGTVVDIGGARHFGPNTHPEEVAAIVAALVSRTASRP